MNIQINKKEILNEIIEKGLLIGLSQNIDCRSCVAFFYKKLG